MNIRFPEKKSFLLVCFVILVIMLIPLIMWGFRLSGYKGNRQNIPSSPSPIPTPKSLLVKGSVPYWDQENAFETFRENVNLFNYVNLFWYYLGRKGEVFTYKATDEDKSIIDFAKRNGVKVSAVVTNLPDFSGSTWDSKRVEDVITSAELRKAHIQSIVEKLNELGFDGIIIDYESVRSDAKDYFSNFIRELSSELHSNNKELAIVFHPRSGDRVKGEENGWFQDWEALVEYSDQLQIMAYNEHWDESRAGPIASAPWIKKIIKYSKEKNIPPEKLFLGVPLYGYDWNKGDDLEALGLTFEDAKKLMSEYDAKEEWDEISQSPHFTYERRDNTHEVWFENARSVSAKIKLAKEAGFRGVTFWRLGNEDPEVWEVLSNIK